MTPLEAKALKLGDTVQFAGYLVRESLWPEKAWVLHERPGHGVVVGRRSYTNGHNIDAGDAISYVVDERFPVVLVSFALHRAIVAVPPDVLEPTTTWRRPAFPSPTAAEDPALFALDDFA